MVERSVPAAFTVTPASPIGIASLATPVVEEAPRMTVPDTVPLEEGPVGELLESEQAGTKRIVNAMAATRKYGSGIRGWTDRMVPLQFLKGPPGPPRRLARGSGRPAEIVQYLNRGVDRVTERRRPVFTWPQGQGQTCEGLLILSAVQRDDHVQLRVADPALSRGAEDLALVSEAGRSLFRPLAALDLRPHRALKVQVV